jgi:hypothetical protein
VNSTPSRAQSARRYASGARKKSPASMTGGDIPVAAVIASYKSVCCGKPISWGVTVARLLRYDVTTSAGSRISAVRERRIHSRGVVGNR